VSNISNIPIYDPTKANARIDSSPTSVADLSKNFLKMLTVQLQNQDPLNPMDNAAMTSQLAALNMVDGINRLNTSVNSLMAQMKSANFMNLTASVGQTAMVPGADMYFAGDPVFITSRLSDPTNSLQALIKDASGELVNKVDLGPANSGDTDFIWDGRTEAGAIAPAGFYRIQFVASDAQGKISTPASYIGMKVASIGQNDTDILVGLSDGHQVKSTEILKWVAV